MKRRNISGLRNEINERAKEFESLSRDVWIKTNSEIDAPRLHALGVVTFRWNVCENKLYSLLWTLLGLPPEEAQALSYDLNLTGVVSRLKALAKLKLKDKKLLIAIENALAVFENCRRNRNQLTHFTFSLVKTPNSPRYRLALAGRARKPAYQTSVPFEDSLRDIRQVARDIVKLNSQLMIIERRVAKRMRPTIKIKLRDWPLSKLQMLPKLLSPSKS